MFQKQQDAAKYLLNEGFEESSQGLVLNPVFKTILDDLIIIKKIPYSNIPHFPTDGNKFAEGNLIYAQWKNSKPLIIMDRPLQYYKGFKANEIIFPIRLMNLLGVKEIFMANFAGSVNPALEKGTFMLTEDFINLISDNPFIGQRDDLPGPRFLDMNEAFCPTLRKKIRKAAIKKHIHTYSGTFLCVPGPSFPSPSEYRFYKTIGADAIGSATLFECMAAHQVDCSFAAITIIVEDCDPNKPDPKNSAQMFETVKGKEKEFSKLLDAILINEQS